MKTVVQVDYIREIRNKVGVSISEIARRLDVCWLTAKNTQMVMSFSRLNPRVGEDVR